MTATISECGTYRYLLARDIDFGSYRHPESFRNRVLLVIMLNPSKADALVDDATIRRLMGYARAWGYGRLEVVNLFAYRATKPYVLRTPGYHEIVGPENDRFILEAAMRADLVVCGWGNHPRALYNRDKEVVCFLEQHGVKLHALKITKMGMPSHPMYLKSDLVPIPYTYGDYQIPKQD